MDKVLCFVCSCTDNANGNNDDNNIIFSIKETKLYVPIVTLSARGNQKLSKFLSKEFDLVYTNHGDNAKRFKARKYYLPKGIVKSYYVIINGKNV